MAYSGERRETEIVEFHMKSGVIFQGKVVDHMMGTLLVEGISGNTFLVHLEEIQFTKRVQEGSWIGCD